MVLNHIAETSQNPRLRVAALEVLTRTLSHDLFDSAEEVTFERALYTTSSQKGLLDRNDIDKDYAEAVQPYEIWPPSEVASSRAWMNKTLLFDDPLYFVNYLYATIIAAALYDRVQTDPTFIEKYERLLQQGFGGNATDLLAKVDIDWTSSKLVDSAVRLLEVKTAELRQAYSTLPQ